MVHNGDYTMDGWIKLHRQLQSNPIWFAEPFTRAQAWVDLLLLANHKDGWFRVRGIRVNVSRGQAGYSIPKLADRWKWSKGKVTRFLDELETDSQIGLQKDNVTCVITITNYNQYQCNEYADDSADRSANGPQIGLQTDLNKNEENVENEEELKKEAPFTKWDSDYLRENIKSVNIGYPTEMLIEFHRYWIEPSASGKLRFHMEKTWDTLGRLRYWAKRGNIKPENEGNDYVH